MKKSYCICRLRTIEVCMPCWEDHNQFTSDNIETLESVEDGFKTLEEAEKALEKYTFHKDDVYFILNSYRK